MEVPLEQTGDRRLSRKPGTIEKKQGGDRYVRRGCRKGRTLAADRKDCRARDHYHHESAIGIEQSQDFFHSGPVGDMRAIVKRHDRCYCYRILESLMCCWILTDRKSTLLNSSH